MELFDSMPVSQFLCPDCNTFSSVPFGLKILPNFMQGLNLDPTRLMRAMKYY